MKRIIISGAPSTGKTSIINLLKKLNYECKDEVSREIITQQININGDIVPWKNINKFSKIILNKRIKQFNNVQTKLCFYDRSIVDIHAYLNVSKHKINTDLISSINEFRYEKIVFYTPIWEQIYTNDDGRKENLILSKKIDLELRKSYNEFNYNIIEVPKTNIEERISFILNHIK
tara:strand:- start:2202 stop:2726 length:525 start_codon:yes stop_codon:yes gene_type:complete